MELSRYRAEARAWLAARKPGALPVEFDAQFAALRGWQRELFDGGWLGIDWPKEVGGQGLTLRHHLAVAEELALSGAPEPVGNIGLDVVGPSILKFGTPGQRAALLPPLLGGEHIWCQGFSEPDAGSDLASLRTSARLVGDTWVVRGQKVWTSWAAQADWCALLARTTPRGETRSRHDGLSYLLVQMNSPGITVRPLVQLTGDAEFCEVFFDDVEVPAGSVLGPVGGGWPVAMYTLGAERSFYMIRRRVEIERAFAATIAELAARKDPSSFESLIHEGLGESVVAIRTLRAQTEAAVERKAEGSGPSATDSLDKLVLAAAEQCVFSAMLRLLGSGRMGLDKLPPGIDARRVSLGYLYSRAASIYGGTAQIQRNIISQRLLGLERSW
jgi:alkylation response protein AidB-like acyl-CoA dehydrogenase